MRLSELMARHFGWEMGGLWLVDEEAGLLRYAGGWCTDDPQLTGFRQRLERLTFVSGVGLPGTVWQSGEPAWLAEVASAPNFPRAELASQAGLRAAVGVPIITPDGVLGVIELLTCEPREADEGDLEHLRTLGRQVGQHVARVRAEERLRTSEETSASIVRAALDCIVTMDHEGHIVDFNPAAETTFGYAREEVVGRMLAEVIIPAEFRAAHHRALARYVETGQASILNQRLELTAMRGDGTTMDVELTVTRLGRREPPVFAGFVRDITQRRLSEQEVSRLLELEHAARIRAEEAERSTRAVADALQQGLLPPRLPVIPDMQFGAAYRAGAEGSEVGGDFYDVFDLGEQRWGIAIGDVRGKGALAASVTALMRWTIRAAAALEERPRDVLQMLNHALRSDTANGDYCTAIFACLDAGSSPPSLRMAIAGHPLPLLRAADGGVATVGVPGTLLGAVPEPEIHEARLTLGPGDVLLLYTDGVTESRTPDGLFGTARLGALLERCAGRTAQEIASSVEAAVVEPPAQAADDVAVLVLRAL